MARTKKGDKPEEGITLFLVDKQTPGLSTYTLTGEEFVWSHDYELTFDSVEVPRASVLGEVDGGWATLSPALDRSIPVLCAYMLGGYQKAYDLSIDYCRTRVQFGVLIGTFARVQDVAIDMVNGLDASRWTTYEALWKVDVGKPDIINAASLAKAVTSEEYYQGCVKAHEIHAGAGVDSGYPLYLYTKDARTSYYYLGEPRYHKQRLGQLFKEGLIVWRE